MTGIEISLLVIGSLFMIGSFFISEKHNCLLKNVVFENFLVLNAMFSRTLKERRDYAWHVKNSIFS